MILKLSGLRVVAFAQFTERSEKTIVTWWVLSTKNLISHSVTRWLSLYPRMLQMFPASHPYFISIDKAIFVLKRFFGNYLNELCLTQ